MTKPVDEALIAEVVQAVALDRITQNQGVDCLLAVWDLEHPMPDRLSDAQGVWRQDRKGGHWDWSDIDDPVERWELQRFEADAELYQCLDFALDAALSGVFARPSTSDLTEANDSLAPVVSRGRDTGR